MKLSLKGMDVLMQREGCRLTAYQDTVGVWTIGYGHTSGAGDPQVKAGMTITQHEANAIFAADVEEFEAGVTALIDAGSTEAAIHEFDAYVSLSYNIGLGAFASSTTLMRFREGNVEGAAEAILWWNKPPEIHSRRWGEYWQFKDGLYFARASADGMALA